MTEQKTEITLIPINSSPKELDTSIETLNKPLAELLSHLGLPTEDILSPPAERRKIIYALESVLEILPLEKRQKAYYLSKFSISIFAGLFDGALTFLWNETINSLEELIVDFDLQYFFSVASGVSSRYKNLHDREELVSISPHDLLEISRRIGLINDFHFEQLKQVNYLRNHASAAHPNQNEISGIKMLSLLEDCIKYVIVAEPDISVIQIKKLRDNIRENEIPEEDFEIIGEDLRKQPQERIDDFLLSLVGLYCDPKQNQFVKNNIEKLIPYIWKCSQEETKYLIGSKFGTYRKNGDVSRRNLIQRLLEIVDALSYKDEDSLTAELIEKLQDLKTAHFSENNFYNEYPHVKSIDASFPNSGIPQSIRSLFVKVISICFCGNGLGYREGVDERALSYYEKFIDSTQVAT